MIGSIIGDVIGSRFEFNNHKSKRFELFHSDCEFTDDTICTIATMDWINNGMKIPYETYLLKWCKKYPSPMGGYGGGFSKWLVDKDKSPYYSFGNGSAMRVAPVGIYSSTIIEALDLAEKTAKVTHNHEEGIKGAKAIALAIYYLKVGCEKDEIREEMEDLGYDLSMTVDDIRLTYVFDESCQCTVPEAIVCFLESDSFEDAIRNAISIGGDSDTIACIIGGLAEAYYGVPSELKKEVNNFIPIEFKNIINEFYERL